MTPDDPRIRRNHRDEWAKLDQRRTTTIVVVWSLTYVAAVVLVLVWIGGAR